MDMKRDDYGREVRDELDDRGRGRREGRMMKWEGETALDGRTGYKAACQVISGG